MRSRSGQETKLCAAGRPLSDVGVRVNRCVIPTRGNTRDVKIMEDFRRRTYFATHLEDALGFGGNRVFEVAFDYASLNWQFTLADQIERRNIVRYSVYTVTRKFENRTLNKRIFLSNLAKEKASHQHAERTNHYLESWMQALRDFYARFTNTRIVL